MALQAAEKKGTFPLAESAVKRLPVTVIAAFGGIILVVLVGGGRKWVGCQGRHRICLLSLMAK